jgi:hypothetical protein
MILLLNKSKLDAIQGVLCDILNRLLQQSTKIVTLLSISIADKRSHTLVFRNFFQAKD